ncbi:ferritin-like domain-containing protein [Pontibacter arcticus]|uniref:Ferritin-like domain-containing protein n=1 Tax=Pontibacter arcticus TaxID=2080288 RepID=A0A364RHK8_9BACT|nr:ferritin-like domain-containing protein [Pontibacter arcticus]RAU83789.1 ferritin-like domain-containing protein [Pontibacter arcticus]
MEKINQPEENEGGISKALKAQMQRRTFFRYAGASAAAATLLLTTSCDDDDDQIDPLPPVGDAVDLGSGDVGILNYAYALEQLEAAFYTQVIATKYAGMTAAETQLLTDIRDHEIAHREFFKAALGNNAIPGLEVNFTKINFNDRASVLGTAKAFEDLGVSAYNGAGQLFTDTGVGLTYLTLAGKIVSVEARHAAAIRDLLNPLSKDFSGDDVVDAKGLDVSRTPMEVLTIAADYIKTKINANNLPK